MPSIDIYEAQQKFIEAMRDGRLALSDGQSLEADGQFHRCDATNKEHGHGKSDGSYFLHLTSDGCWGGFHNYTLKTGFVPWHHRSPSRRLSAEEQLQIDREYKEHRAAAKTKQAKARAKATREAKEHWRAAEPAGGKPDFETHQYLRAKEIKAHGTRVLDGLLLVPMYSYDGKLVNLHKINSRGDKWVIKGGQKIKTYGVIKAAPDDDGSTICIAEGFSTGASINEAKGHQVYLSLGTEILPLAHWLTEQRPKRKLIICADHDWKEPDNPGLTAALKAARATNAWLAVPLFPDNDRQDTDTDFNDLAHKLGAKAVCDSFEAAINPDDLDMVMGTEETEIKGVTMTDSQADTLVRLTEAEEVELFHSLDDNGYADLVVNGHREVWPIRSKRFKHWLMRQFYLATNKAPGSEAISTALNMIESKAFNDGEQHPVFVRVGNFKGKVYLDLCDEDWRTVRIDQNGWKIVKEPPVRFIRRKGMQALPVPTEGGSVEDLRMFINVKDDEFVLVVSFLLAALRGRKPFPVLFVSGESGSAKSTLLQVLRALVDPNTADLRAPPRSNRDLFIAASNAYVVCFDNLSELPIWLSDTLARLATGAGFGTRQLYSDDEEKLFNAARPIQLGAIENVLTKGDIVQRSVIVKLSFIPEKARRDEDEFWSTFQQAQPKILGALLTAVSQGLKTLPTVHLKRKPRMADFAAWGVAVGKSLWGSGIFMKAYRANQTGAVADVVEANMLASEIQRFMASRKGESWTGTATRLWRSLHDGLDDEQRKSKAWPKAAHILSRKLPEVTGDLRKLGIKITESPRDDRHRKQLTIELTSQALQALQALQPKRHKAFKHKARNACNASNASDGTLPGKAHTDKSWFEEQEEWEQDRLDDKANISHRKRKRRS